MDRDQLREWLEDGLSLAQIAALTNRDRSTVGYWVRKHGLVANGRARYAPRGGLSRDQLERLVERGATLAEIAAEVGRSTSTVRHWLKKHGLRTRNRHGRRSARLRDEVDRAVRSGTRSLIASCPRHGRTEFAIVGAERRLRCRRCLSEAVARRRRRVKEILVAEAGGRCELCGYQRFVGALEFHHRDPAEKTFGVAHRGVTRSLDEVRKEVAKCALLCGNCHAEVEAGVASLA